MERSQMMQLRVNPNYVAGMQVTLSMRARRYLTALVLAPLVAACDPAASGMEEEAPATEAPASETEESVNAEEAFPGQSGTTQTAILDTEDGPQSITYELIDNYMVLEGDIMLGRFDAGSINYSATLRAGTWPGCVIPYVIDSQLPNQQRVLDAIKHWEAKTQVRFVKRTNQEDYLNFEDGGKGCWSYIGRRGGGQLVSLAKNCSTGSAIHEIAHALGIYHEQSRQDRDNYVKVLWNNIEQGKESNFNKYQSSRGVDVGSFDFNSIMLYPWNAFSRNGNPTILRKDGSKYTAQRSSLSSGDLAGIARLCR
jgi:hypothetical protein